MPTVPINLGIGTRRGRNGRDGTVNLINCAVIDAGPQAPFRYPIYAMDGLKSFATLTGANGGVRGMLEVDGQLVVVAGRDIYTVTAQGTVTRIDGIPDTGPVFMEQNRAEPAQVVIVTRGGLAFEYRAGTLTQITDSDLEAPSHLGWLNGHFLFPTATQNSGRLRYTELDSIEIAPLDVVTAEYRPDPLRGVAITKSNVWLLGSTTTEIWQPNVSTDAAAAAFVRIPGAAVEYGCELAASIAVVDEAPVWLDNDGAIRMGVSMAGEQISNEDVERTIKAETDRDSIRGFAYRDAHHSWYVIRGATFCFAFDATLARAVGYGNAWTQRESYGQTTWRVGYVRRFGRKLIAGDATTGTLYELDENTYDEAGNPLRMIIRPSLVQSYPNQVVINAVHINAGAGVGLNTTDTAELDPEIMLRWSRNAGKTWKGPKKKPLGRLGDYERRVRFSTLGQFPAHGAALEFSITANVKKAIYAASAEIEGTAA